MKLKQQFSELKKWFMRKKVLTVLFLKRFFDWKELVFATFTYEITGNHKSPKRDKHIVIARISRNATADAVKEKLFTLKPSDKRYSFKVIDVKLLPVGKVKRCC